jgi:hypothetical protein
MGSTRAAYGQPTGTGLGRPGRLLAWGGQAVCWPGKVGRAVSHAGRANVLRMLGPAESRMLPIPSSTALVVEIAI